MKSSIPNGKVPRTMSVKDAAALLGLTPGGLRGAILRGKLHAEKNGDGQLVIRSHNLAAYHLYGDGSAYPEERMGPSARVHLHDYLETMCGG